MATEGAVVQVILVSQMPPRCISFQMVATTSSQFIKTESVFKKSYVQKKTVFGLVFL